MIYRKAFFYLLLLPVVVICIVCYHVYLHINYTLWSDLVDVHYEYEFENQSVTHSFVINHLSRNEIRIAVGGGITSRGIKDINIHNMEMKFHLFPTFLTSFCLMTSPNYGYEFYFAYDWNETFFRNNSLLTAFSGEFEKYFRSNCSHLRLSLHLVRCGHVGKPTWAQNDAMMEAYLDGVDYFYRVNDDTKFLTKNWAEIFIKRLSQYHPPNLGVVGPKHSGGETSILTYDFVHRTHIDVFGFYYPRHFENWYADTWISEVYPANKTSKMQNVRVMHTMLMGTRYRPSYHLRKGLQGELDSAKRFLSKFEFSRLHPIQPDPRKVISMALYGHSDDINMGAIRNSQLFPIHFPGWTLRIYVNYLVGGRNPMVNQSTETLVSQRIITNLRNLGAQVVLVDPKSTRLRPELWSYLVVNDEKVDYFVIRKATHRVNLRDFQAVEDFIKKHKAQKNQTSEGVAFHCIRDRYSHTNMSIVPGLWGGNRRDVIKNFDKRGFLKTISDLIEFNESLSEADILHKVLWTNYTNKFLCHDSISCNKWSPTSINFPGNSVPLIASDVLAVEHDLHHRPINFSIDLESDERSKIVDSFCNVTFSSPKG